MDEYLKLLDELAVRNDTKIIFFIIDGLGGLPMEPGGKTELEAAHTPNLDALAAQSACGLLEPIGPGIAPGSGPGHFALFGYNPIKTMVGRGRLEAAGIGLEMTERDVAVRINFCTVDERGNITDRRAGRLATDVNAKLCRKLAQGVKMPRGVELIIEPVKEHRAALLFRGGGLSGEVEDTDPQKTGVPPLRPVARVPEAEGTVALAEDFLSQAKEILADERPANMVLLRGFDKYTPIPSMEERFGLKCLAIASYPMYKGLAGLVGMKVLQGLENLDSEMDALTANYKDYDFFFFHAKEADARGEDGDFDGKVKALERVDAYVSRVAALAPDVLVVTGDHSTPALMKKHSFHPVPVLLHSKYARVDDVKQFDEKSCAQGSIGRLSTVYLMGLALAHAERLAKYGA